MVIVPHLMNMPIDHLLPKILYVVKEFTVLHLLKSLFSLGMDTIPHRLKIIPIMNIYIVHLLQNDLFITKGLTTHLLQQDLLMMKGGIVLLHLKDIYMVTELYIHLLLKDLYTLREVFVLPHLKDLYMVRGDFVHPHPKGGQNHQLNIHLTMSTIHTQKFYYADN